MFEDSIKEFVQETMGYTPTDEEMRLFMQDLSDWYDEEHKYSQKG